MNAIAKAIFQFLGRVKYALKRRHDEKRYKRRKYYDHIHDD